MDRIDQDQNPKTLGSQGFTRLTPERALYWGTRLGRIRLGVEPVEGQLEIIHKMTWVIIGVVTFFEVFFMSLFLGFGRPDIGLVLVGISLVPIELMAWFDYIKLKNRVKEYLDELGAH